MRRTIKITPKLNVSLRRDGFLLILLKSEQKLGFFSAAPRIPIREIGTEFFYRRKCFGDSDRKSESEIGVKFWAKKEAAKGVTLSCRRGRCDFPE